MLTSIAQLEEIYGKPHDRSVWKEIPTLNADYRAFVAAAPLVIIASSGPDGLDCSPRGDRPGFVGILDDRTLAIPDRPGNNRIDTLRNLVVDPRVALIFIIPGIGETLRVNGRAAISTAPDLLESFAVAGKLPKTVLLIAVESVFFHCSKALIRSQLWDPTRHLDRAHLPSPGAMLRRLSEGPFDAEGYDRDLPERIRTGLY